MVKLMKNIMEINSFLFILLKKRDVIDIRMEINFKKHFLLYTVLGNYRGC
jgi:hypothetical protein